MKATPKSLNEKTLECSSADDWVSVEIGYGRCSWRLFSSSIQSSGTECACTLTAKDAAKTISQRPKILQKTNAPAKPNVLAQCIVWGARSKIDANIGTENN